MNEIKVYLFLPLMLLLTCENKEEAREKKIREQDMKSSNTPENLMNVIFLWKIMEMI